MSFFNEVYAKPNPVINGRSILIDEKKTDKIETIPLSDYGSIDEHLADNEKLHSLLINGVALNDAVEKDMQKDYSIGTDSIWEWFYNESLHGWILEQTNNKKKEYSSTSQVKDGFGLNVKSSKGTVEYSFATMAFLISDSSKKEIEKVIPINYSGKFKETVEKKGASSPSFKIKVKDYFEGEFIPSNYVNENYEIKTKKDITKKIVKVYYDAKGIVRFEWTPYINGKYREPIKKNLEIKFKIERTLLTLKN